ncbi:TSUP family transporter [Denitromonas sp. IR12]|uniref:Probable membrane transporter protein n=1 Tax=Denitromonas iodatirespirans TaxID=2795389 RepID=A0A944DIG4_DENI1|nr:TSUP family transporter [Denitromonas iodatirespirans]
MLAGYFALSPRMADHDTPPRLSPRLFDPVVGGGLGLYGGVFGPGMGSFSAAAFAGLRGFNMRKATACTKPLVLVANVTSMLIFVAGGHVLWALALAMAVAQFAGARLGSNLVIARGAALVRPVIIAATVAIAVRLLLR